MPRNAKKSLNLEFMLKNILLPFGICVLGIFLVGRDLFGFGDKEWHYAGDMWDTRHANFILEHNYRFLTGIEKDYWTAGFFYPGKNTMAGADTYTSTAIIYIIFRTMGWDQFVSFNLWVASIFIINFIVIFIVLRLLNIKVIIAAAGAYLFTFSLPVIGQIYHVQTLNKFPIPLIFYFTFRFFQTLHKRYIILAALSFVLLTYSSLYFLVFTTIPYILFVIYLAIVCCLNDQQHTPNTSKFLYFFNNILNIIKMNWKGLLAGTIIIVVALIPLARKYLHHHIPWSSQLIINNLPNLWCYILPVNGSALYSWIYEKINQYVNEPWYKCYNFGILTLFAFLLLSIYALKNKVKDAIAWLIPIYGMVVIFTRIDGYAIYQHLTHLYGFSSAKASWRFFLVTLSLISVAFPLIINKINFISKNPIMQLVILLIIVVENFTNRNTMKYTLLDEVRGQHLPLVNCILENKKPNHKAFVVLPHPNSQINSIDIVSAMMAYQATNLPTINGYSTFYPEKYCLDWLLPTREQVERWLKLNNWQDEEIQNNILYIYYDGSKYQVLPS